MLKQLEIIIHQDLENLSKFMLMLLEFINQQKFKNYLLEKTRVVHQVRLPPLSPSQSRETPGLSAPKGLLRSWSSWFFWSENPDWLLFVLTAPVPSQVPFSSPPSVTSPLGL
jgi:hypothetical protein